MDNKKRVYTFGNGKAEGNASMRETLGGKGANLSEMNLVGVPVPPGFTIITDVCNEDYEVGQEKIVEILDKEVKAAVAHVESLMNNTFGDPKNPLLLSVRSGARASMPGMMDTILNLGLNDEVAAGLVEKSMQDTTRLSRVPTPTPSGPTNGISRLRETRLLSTM